MYPILHECPICAHELIATQLNCRECGTSITGRFVTGPFTQLNSDQLDFVEMFVRHEGKITRLEKEMGLSYPTIRNRLLEVIRAMGYEPGKDEFYGLSDKERKSILEDLESGEINYEEAMQKIRETEEI